MDWLNGLIELAKPFIASSIRHTVTGIGMVLVHDGAIQSSDLNRDVGAVMLLIGIGWSWYQKRGHQILQQKLHTFEAMARK